MNESAMYIILITKQFFLLSNVIEQLFSRYMCMRVFILKTNLNFHFTSVVIPVLKNRNQQIGFYNKYWCYEYSNINLEFIF
jgi:hypothetical protein